MRELCLSTLEILGSDVMDEMDRYLLAMLILMAIALLIYFSYYAGYGEGFIAGFRDSASAFAYMKQMPLNISVVP